MKDIGIDNISIQGHSHILNNKECQDGSVSWQGNGYAAVVISDGHGSDKHFRSAKGSNIACKVGQDAISSFMEAIGKGSLSEVFVKNVTKREEMLSRLERSIIQGWNEEVAADTDASPFENDERFLTLNEADKESVSKAHSKAYGATFIAVVLTKSYFFALKLGDGNVCVLKDGAPSLFVGLSNELCDDELQFNITTSLCNSDADNEFKHCFVSAKELVPDGLILTTDGIINSYTSVPSFLDFIGNIFASYREDSFEAAHDELIAFLPALSKKGSGDDLTVGIIFRKAKDGWRKRLFSSFRKR